MAGRLVRGIPVRAALLAALVLGALGGAAASPAASSACIPPADGPEVCLEVVPSPENPVVSTAGAATYTSFATTVANRSGQTVTHVALVVEPIVGDVDDGFVFFSATPSAGTCSYDAATDTLACDLDSLARGEEASVEVVLQTPSTPGEAPLDFTASVDERGSDSPDSPGKVDTVSLTEETTVLPPDGPSGATFVPEGVGVELDITDAGQTGGVTLPPQDFSTTAELEFTGTDEIPFQCPSVCRGGDWFSATIPGTFDPPAEFDLFWPSGLVSPKQSVRNFVLFYVAFPGAPVQAITARCDATLSVIPCLKDVTLFKKGPLKGGLAATVVKPDNGHMR